MKKIEYFLQDYGILVKICLVVVWVLWALQSAGPMKEAYNEEMAYQKTRNIEADQKAMQEMFKLGNELEKEANRLGENYGPKEYFADLKKIREKELSLRTMSSMITVNNLQSKIWENEKKGKFTTEQIRAEAEKFSDWNKDKISHRDEFKKSLTLDKFINWLSTMYLRTCLLVVLFYLTNMADRRGILETFLADKAKFVYSILLWPIFFFKYPVNVIREIRVEAELRRFKDLFRKLSPKELILVREVANSSNYYCWLNQNRRHQRGLILALTATLFIHLLLPSLARANQFNHQLTITTSISKVQQIKDTSQDETQTSSSLAIIEKPVETEPPTLIGTVVFITEIWQSCLKGPLLVIPRNTLFGTLKKITNQIMKGITSEKLPIHFVDYSNQPHYRLI
jgi:hypothetical protein